jgi:hypothetical protein
MVAARNLSTNATGSEAVVKRLLKRTRLMDIIYIYLPAQERTFLY